MRYLIAGVCVLLALVGGCIWLLTIGFQSSPHAKKPATLVGGGLEWETIEFKYQAAPEDESVVAVFPFTNTSDNAITIKNVRYSCGCLSRKLVKKIYGPGESGELEIEFRFGQRTGKQIKSAVVYTDNRRHPMDRLVLHVDIPQPIKVWPKLVYWRKGEEKNSKIVNVEFDAVTSGKITKVMPASPLVTAKIKERKAGKKYEVVLTPNEAGRAGQIAVKIVTDLPYPRLRNQVIYARVLSVGQARVANQTLAHAQRSNLPMLPVKPVSAPLRLEPDTVQWNIGERPEPKSIRVLAVSDNRVFVESVSAANDDFRVKVKTITKGKEYELIVTPHDTSKTTIDMLLLQVNAEQEGGKRSLIEQKLPTAFAVVVPEF